LRSPEYAKLFTSKESEDAFWQQRTPDRGSILRVAETA
jgi:hypothetical protein